MSSFRAQRLEPRLAGRRASVPRSQQMALSARPWSLEAGSGPAAREGGPWARETRQGPHPPRRRFLSSPRARGPSRKRRREASRKGPANAHGNSGPGSPGNMGVLRAGLCPGLTQDVVQLLRSRGIKTGDRVCAPHSWAHRGGHPHRPDTPGRGIAPPSSAPHPSGEARRVGVGTPKPRQAPTVCWAPRQVLWLWQFP